MNLRTLRILASALLVPLAMQAQTPVQNVVNTRLVAAPQTATSAAESVVAAPQSAASITPPLPSIDNGPRDLIPTDHFVKRYLVADFENKFNQDAAVYLPIYYHAGYLLLSPEDRVEMRQIQNEVNQWITDQDALLRRGADILQRFEALHQRGRPRGLVPESQLLVPYGGSESKVTDELDPLVIVPQRATSEPAKPSAVTGDARAVTIRPPSTSN